ncbi:MAG TPA: arylamine N-acetyltransferase, partial [Brevibacillus sp.]|nr:arylamine N-acetyltransferase [Brevibacillus sp.]
NFDPSEAKEIHDFSESVALTFQPDATYMGCLRVQLYQLDRGRSLSLLNNSLQIMMENGTEEKILLHSLDEMEAVVAEEFGLPRLPVREAIAILLKKGIDVFAPED